MSEPNQVSVDIADKLVSLGAAAGRGAGAGWRVFRKEMPVVKKTTPQIPSTVILLIDQGGLPPDRVMDNTKPKLHNPGLQIMVRAGTDDAAHQKMMQVYRLLDQIDRFTTSDTDWSIRYEGVFANSDPFPLPNEESDDSLYVCNFIVSREITYT